MIKKAQLKRFRDIAADTNKDSSDEYYTLYHSFMALFLELLCRYKKGKQYKVIICPCDAPTSIFRKLEEYKDLIGNPQIIYSYWPDKDWADYFDLDFLQEYGCKSDEVCIFTNPPFKKLSENVRKIKCDFLVFGSNTTGINNGLFCKDPGCVLYIKNNIDFDGNVANAKQKYGTVRTFFVSNNKFESAGDQFAGIERNSASVLFGKDKLLKIKWNQNDTQ
jgi:hypothetical protein